MSQQVERGRSRLRRTTGGESQKSFPARFENPVAGGFAVVGDYNANVAMLPLSFPVGALRCSALNSPASAARPKKNSQTIWIAVSKTTHRSQLSANRIATEAERVAHAPPQSGCVILRRIDRRPTKRTAIASINHAWETLAKRKRNGTDCRHLRSGA
jgi:hypothetical protein